MDTNYLDAHERHWADAELLNSSSRIANADHMYGLSVECGLKRLMVCFGMPLVNDIPNLPDRKHADVIWDRFETYRSGHAQGIGFTLPSANPFSSWKVDQRYASRSCFDQFTVDQHRQGALLVSEFIARARIQGIL